MSPRTVGAVLRKRVEEDPDAVFLICDDERLTYGELQRRSAEAAKALLAAGAGHGTHVALLMPNGADFAVAAVAIMRIGAVAVPMSTLSSVAELRTLVDGSDTRLLLAVRSVRGRAFDELLSAAVGGLPSVLAPALQRIVFADEALAEAPASDELFAAAEDRVRPADPVVIVHTSGSTSAPKGVVHSHGGLLDHLVVLNELRDYGPGEILFSNSPFFWIGGFAYTFLGTLVAGATVLCSQEGDPAKVLDLLERERPTMCNGYAASATALAADPSFAGRDLSSMTRGNLYALMPAGSVPADPALRTNMLGMTEGGSVVMTGTAAEAEA
ncbi:MAG: class I adenylate-forming enzyme family protein, partial [Nocardioides sp.]